MQIKVAQILSGLACFCLVFFCQSAVFAQLPALLNAAENSPAPERQSIAIADIPSQISSDQILLQDMIKRSANAAPVTDFKPELAAMNTAASQLGQHINVRKLAAMSFSRLETLDRHLSFIDQQASALQAALTVSTQPLSEDIAQLTVRRALWRETTRENTGLLSQQLQKSIEQLDQDFTSAELAVSTPLNALMSLNQQVGGLRNSLLDQQKIVRQYIANTDKLLWNIDSPSLWSAMFNADVSQSINKDQLADSFAIETEFMQQSQQSSRGLHSLLLVLIAVLLILLLWLAKQAKSLPPDLMQARYRPILARPISAWLLLSTTIYLIENVNGSYLRLQILLLLAWLPVMRLQSVRMHQAVGVWMYSTLLFFFVHVMGNVVAYEPLEFRLCLLLNASLMLGTMLVILMRLRARKLDLSPRIQQLSMGFVGLAGALMVVALLCNVFGNVHLATLLVQGTLYSIYMGLFILAARNTVLAYVRLFLTSSTPQLLQRTQHAHRLFGVSQRLFNLALMLAWLIGVLDTFRVLRSTQDMLAALGAFTLAFGSISITVGGIALFFVSVYLSFWLAQTLRSILSEDVLPHMTLPRGVANSVSTMSYYFLLMLGLMVALSAAGFQLTQLAMVLGALSVGIGFGLQTVVNNFVSGLILMVERPIQPGDTVELSGTTGSIRDIGMRTTTLSTFDGADVVVPNGMLLSEKLINWTLNNQRRRIEIPIGVSYDCDPRSVQAILLEVARKTPGVSLEPAPAAVFMGFGESSLDFSVRAWTDHFDQWLMIRSEMALEIHAALKAANIEIPYPQRDIHIRTVADKTITGNAD
ncbi:mechanosensitive ion channel [Chitinibacter bivalviorum]|uniref:Mechanosensitive ion channel n=1 Tax=Chitinibacter bivalviorum TaxID=2739434 RepID=A0A7H9BIE5_9NEIS|nr:mechanosensitive ion channel domain-containing protein [Chitinibacter bivalviorum]QLG88407.1 mechanosensitive ion channel [Chitinibacter bivalviorum]